jgi:hypothetical protein
MQLPHTKTTDDGSLPLRGKGPVQRTKNSKCMGGHCMWPIRGRRVLVLALSISLSSIAILTSLLGGSDTNGQITSLRAHWRSSPEQSTREEGSEVLVPITENGSDRTVTQSSSPAQQISVSSPEISSVDHLIYSYSLAFKIEGEELSASETTGDLSLQVGPLVAGERSCEAQLEGVMAQRSEGWETAILEEAMASRVHATLGTNGAIKTLSLPDQLSAGAKRYWKSVLGRWQTAHAPGSKPCQRWMAFELNGIGSGVAEYRLDEEGPAGSIVKRVKGYKIMDAWGPHMRCMTSGEARITMDCGYAISIRGSEEVQGAVGRSGGHRIEVAFTFQRTSCRLNSSE